MMFKYYKNDKEFEQDKAIEEMTDYLFGNAIPHDTQFKEDCRSIARDLICEGYRKIPENAVVLTREEYERLKSIEKLLDDGYFSSDIYYVKRNTRKETAEKFKKVLESKLYPLVKGWDYFWYNQYEVHNAIRETCKKIIGEEK